MKAYYFEADPIELRKLVVARLKELGYETIIRAYSFPFFIINGFRDGEITTIGERAYCVRKGYEPGSLSALFNSDEYRFENPKKEFPKGGISTEGTIDRIREITKEIAEREQRGADLKALLQSGEAISKRMKELSDKIVEEIKSAKAKEAQPQLLDSSRRVSCKVGDFEGKGVFDQWVVYKKEIHGIVIDENGEPCAFPMKCIKFITNKPTP